MVSYHWLSASTGNYDVHGIKDGRMYKPPTVTTDIKGSAQVRNLQNFSDCTSIKNLEREPVLLSWNQGEILAGISADFVSDGKYLKVTHTW